MKYKLVLLMSLSLLSLSSIYAQDEQRTNNSDLRGGRVLFSIDHQQKNYSLLRSTAGDHSLVTINKGVRDNEKMNSKVAMVLDDEISAEFINLKYFMGEIDSCGKYNLILMREEELRVCPKDKKRLLKVAELVKLIESKK